MSDVVPSCSCSRAQDVMCSACTKYTHTYEANANGADPCALCTFARYRSQSGRPPPAAIPTQKKRLGLRSLPTEEPQGFKPRSRRKRQQRKRQQRKR